jgi:murein endopeptidase
MIGNYVSKISHKKYTIEMLVLCPKLVKVDEVMINPHVREAFKVKIVLTYRSWLRKIRWS